MALAVPKWFFWYRLSFLFLLTSTTDWLEAEAGNAYGKRWSYQLLMCAQRNGRSNVRSTIGSCPNVKSWHFKTAFLSLEELYSSLSTLGKQFKYTIPVDNLINVCLYFLVRYNNQRQLGNPSLGKKSPYYVIVAKNGASENWLKSFSI